MLILKSGTITFIEQNQNHFLIKRERFPELQNISKTEFEKLFPYESFDKKDTEIVEKKIKTIPFDTDNSTTIDLDFLKNFEPKKYKILVEAKDQKGNEINTEAFFELLTTKKTANKEKLFTLNQIESDKNNFIFEIQSVILDLFITSRMYADEKNQSQTVIQLKNGSALVKFPKKNSYSTDVNFHFSTLWENNYFADEVTISKDEIVSSEAANQEAMQTQTRQVTETITRDQPKINRNDNVTIKHVMSGKTETMKYKKAEGMLATGEWVLVND